MMGRVAGSIMVNVKVDGSMRPMRAFHSVLVTVADSDRAPVRSRYVSVREVRDSAAMSEQVVERARRELAGWRDRYALYEEYFGPVFRAIEALGGAA